MAKRRQQLAAVQLTARKRYLIAGGAALLVGALYLAYQGEQSFVDHAWANGKDLGPINLSPIGGGHFLRDDVAVRFKQMQLAAKADGVLLTAISGFRSYAKQAALYSTAVAAGAARLAAGLQTTPAPYPPTAPPGFSNHNAGVAVDVDTPGVKHVPGDPRGRDTQVFRWLQANAARFGFYNLPSEFWHWSTDGH